jgi:16S rRNA (guanine527-N7)-methyltransferase
VSFVEILESEFLEFRVRLEPAQTTALALYCDELARWNKKINLTSLAGRELVRRLVVEPVWVGLQMKLSGALLDIGSGNGSPAIPLHVVCRFSKCHLIEARAKRAAFLRHMAVQLRLPEVEIHRARFEEIAQDVGAVNWVTLQAVALTPDLMASIQKVATSTTNVVWLTSSATTCDIPPARVLTIPITGTKAYLFEASPGSAPQK